MYELYETINNFHHIINKRENKIIFETNHCVLIFMSSMLELHGIYTPYVCSINRILDKLNECNE